MPTQPLQHTGVEEERLGADARASTLEAAVVRVPPQRGKRRRWLRPGAAAGLVALVGCTVWLLPSVGKTHSAAAALLERAQNATVQLPPGQAKHVALRIQYDARSPLLTADGSTPPAATLLETWVKQGRTHLDAHMEITSGDNSVQAVYGDDTYMLYLPAANQVITGPLAPALFDTLYQQLLPLAGASHQKVVGQEELNGHATTRVQYDVTIPKSVGPSGIGSMSVFQPGSRIKATAWIDTSSNQVLREEGELDDRKGAVLMSFTEDITVFETVAVDQLQPGWFEVQLPAGATVTQQPLTTD